MRLEGWADGAFTLEVLYLPNKPAGSDPMVVSQAGVVSLLSVQFSYE